MATRWSTWALQNGATCTSWYSRRSGASGLSDFRPPTTETAAIIAQNLRYATRSENEADKVRHGTRLSGARALNGRKTSCPRGHAYDYIRRGKRYCRICQRERRRRYSNEPEFRERKNAKERARYRAKKQQANARKEPTRRTGTHP